MSDSPAQREAIEQRAYELYLARGCEPEENWMWFRVDSCNDERQIVFGVLDSEPVLDHGGKLRLGSELAVTYSNIREYRKPSDFNVQ